MDQRLLDGMVSLVLQAGQVMRHGFELLLAKGAHQGTLGRRILAYLVFEVLHGLQ